MKKQLNRRQFIQTSALGFRVQGTKGLWMDVNKSLYIEGKSEPYRVYDAASWLAITPLSEDSIAMGSQPVAIPDFTRGRWTMREPVFGLSDDY